MVSTYQVLLKIGTVLCEGGASSIPPAEEWNVMTVVVYVNETHAEGGSFLVPYLHVKTGINMMSAVGSSQQNTKPSHSLDFFLFYQSVTKLLENGRQIICLTANHLF